MQLYSSVFFVYFLLGFNGIVNHVAENTRKIGIIDIGIISHISGDCYFGFVLPRELRIDHVINNRIVCAYYVSEPVYGFRQSVYVLIASVRIAGIKLSRYDRQMVFQIMPHLTDIIPNNPRIVCACLCK